MFGIGISELIVILVIAIIVIGPEKLPDIAKALAKAFAEFKKAAEEVKSSVQDDIEKAAQEKTSVKYPSQTASSQEIKPVPESSNPGKDV